MIEKENYFENDELAYEVWKSKYQLNNETLDEFFQRIAREFARLDNFKNVKDIDILMYILFYAISLLYYYKCRIMNSH